MTAELRLLDAAADYGLCPMPTPDQELHSMLSWIRMKNQVPKSRLPWQQQPFNRLGVSAIM